ncbi:hypothetical protein [Legionella septentrionalis]|uniref:Transporter n=1 Tax=Legionella septentrionalis TaxID=2498109 RepID=A0A3S0XTL8_9GAMM|nr:hypothetical protein [Legionella septentrionalis]RUQ88853.1 hypothetical protein EKM59_04770 [Legionella septentrionalis]RUR02965.1 hypothetical protein ELY11_01005 [Legionella septentrionalis]
MKLQRITTAFMLFFCSSAFALGDWYDDWSSSFTRVITLTGGVALANPGQNQTFYLSRVENIPIIGVSSTGAPVIIGSIPVTNTFSNTYNAHKKTEVMGTGEVFFALQWPFPNGVLNQLGVAFGGASDANIKGTVSVNAVPTGSSYQYNVNHGKAVIRDKLIFAPFWNSVQPFLTGSLGASFNKSHGFSTAPTVDPNFSATWFENNTQSFSFTYSVGLGLQKCLNNNWNISLGYEFEDWGRSSLGQGIVGTQQSIVVSGTSFVISQPITYNGPSLSHLYTHNILLSISYLF